MQAGKSQVTLLHSPRLHCCRDKSELAIWPLLLPCTKHEPRYIIIQSVIYKGTLVRGVPPHRVIPLLGCRERGSGDRDFSPAGSKTSVSAPSPHTFASQNIGTSATRSTYPDTPQILCVRPNPELKISGIPKYRPSNMRLLWECSGLGCRGP
jgi:hypothetical protein